MFGGGFKRSGLFGLVGVIVVAAIVATIGLSSESGDADPKTTYALIFGVVGIFLVILFVLQRSDLNRVSGADARGSERGAAEGGFVPLLIGAPIIVIAALWGSIRALMPGGEMDKGYENVGVAMAPLGFEVTERPQVSIETRDAVTGRVGPKIHGALVLEGERNGRRVTVRLGGGDAEVTVAATAPAFEAKSRDGRVRPAKDAPAEITDALKAVPNSTRWKKVTVEGGPAGIEVKRKGSGQADWLCDLWLAERLAAA